MSTFEIKTTVTTQDVLNMFEEAGRGNNFTYEGLEEILNHLESYTEDGVIDLDIIAICCDYTESTLDEFISDFNLCKEDYMNNDELNTSDLEEYAQNEQIFAKVLNNGNIIYLNY